MGLAGKVIATVYKTEPISQVSGMENLPNFDAGIYSYIDMTSTSYYVH